MPDTRKLQRSMSMEEVPAPKFRVMLLRTLIGTLFVGVGVAGMWMGWPWPPPVALVLIGATTWSTQIVLKPLKALLDPAQELFRLLRGGP
jgi:fatty acid desaturase